MDPVSSYHALTAAVVGLTGSDKLAHVHAGLAIYLGMQAVARDRGAATQALGIVFLLAVANEIMDRLFCGSSRWADTLGDVAATMFWPGAFWWLARYRRTRWQESRLRQRAGGIAPVQERIAGCSKRASNRQELATLYSQQIRQDASSHRRHTRRGASGSNLL